MSTSTPKLPLAALAVLVIVTLGGIAAVRYAGVGGTAAETYAPAVSERALHFEDRSDGSIDVVDAKQGQVIDTVEPGTNGFLRSAMRGLARERKRNGLGPEQPFRLVSRSDGRLTLEDPATGRRIDLEAFGAANAGAFAKLLPPAAPAAAKERS